MKSYIQYTLSILIFLFILLVLPLSLLFLTYSFKERKQTFDQYNTSQIQTANGLIKFIDYQFSNLTQSNYSITQDELLSRSLKQQAYLTTSLSESIDLFERKKCIARLKNFLALTPIVNDIFIVSKLDDTLVTTQGWFTNESFSDTYFPNHTFNNPPNKDRPKFPLNILNLCKLKDCPNPNCQNTFYLSCFPYASNPTFKVVFAINQNALSSYIQSFSTDSFANQHISLQDHTLYTANTSPLVYDYSFTSTMTNINYTFEFLPLHIPFFIDNLLISFIFICLICFLGAILLTTLLANPTYRIYSKIYNASDSLTLTPRKSVFRLDCFFLLIENYINTILTSQIHLSSQLSSYRTLLNDTLLLNLLLTHDIENYVQELIEICPWFTPSAHYSILLINTPNTSPEVMLPELNKLLTLLGDQHNFEHHYMYILNSDITLLLLYKDSPSLKIEILLNMLHTQLPSMQFSSGSIEQGILGIQTSYHQARKQQQQLLYNDTTIIEGYFYPINLELQLITSLKTGNPSKMQEILNLIFNQNAALSLSDSQLKKLYLVIFETFNRYAKDNALNIDSLREAFITGLQHSLADIPALLLKLCFTLAHSTLTLNTTHMKLLEQEILSYISSNFHDPSLCIESIANKYQISRSHLQKIIKNSSSFTPSELINKLRVEKAISLIELNNRTITEISKEVGYDSYSTFKRIFSKATGLSPSEYRQLHCSK